MTGPWITSTISARFISDGSTVVLACVKDETNITVFQSTSIDEIFLYKESYIVNNNMTRTADKGFNGIIALIFVFLFIILIRFQKKK